MKRLLAAFLIVITLGPFVPITAQGQVVRPPDVGQVISIQCPIDVPDLIMVECGALQAPENYDDPNSEEIRLPYIILHSTNPDPAPDPLIFTAGGPGYSSLDSVWMFEESPILEERDVIIFEQRGNRHAEPAFACDSSMWWEEAPGHTLCLDSIKANGVDIAQYNTQNIVRDMIILRQALGYEQWNLYGGSFSTSLMLSIMDADPDGVRSAILHSVKPPNETTFAHEADSALRAIQQMFADCAADDLCAAAYPDLEAQFYALVKDLNESPVEVEVISSIDDALIPVEIDGNKFIDWIILQRFYQPAFPPFGTAYLPLLISEVSGGNLAPLRIAVQSFWSGMIENRQWSWGLMLAINCQQAMPAAGSNRPAADIAASEVLDGFNSSAAQRAICEAWELPALPPPAREYVNNDLPALVLAGSYDPVTPPAWSRTTAEHLPNSTYVEFASYGHDVTINNPCAVELQVAFLRDPKDRLDVNCEKDASGPSFVLPEDVYIAPGLASSGDDISLGDPQGKAWIEMLAVVSMLGLLISLVALLILGLVWLVRWRKGRAQLDETAAAAYLLALLVKVIVLAMPVLTTRINAEYLGNNMMLYSLGPSRDFGPAVLLAWITPLGGLLILTLAIMTLWAWLVRRWSIGFRVVTTLVVLASPTMVMPSVRWGLYSMLV